MTTRDTGALWENVAMAHLARAGLRLLTRNFTCRSGELDLIMRDGDSVVFVEVRYRGSRERGGGAASVGAGKRVKLVRAAQVYLLAHPQFASAPCRFDVVGCGGTPQRPELEWVRAAFEAF